MTDVVRVTFPSGTKVTCSADLAERLGVKPAPKQAAKKSAASK